MNQRRVIPPPSIVYSSMSIVLIDDHINIYIPCTQSSHRGYCFFAFRVPRPLLSLPTLLVYSRSDDSWPDWKICSNPERTSVLHRVFLQAFSMFFNARRYFDALEGPPLQKLLFTFRWPCYPFFGEVFDGSILELFHHLPSHILQQTQTWYCRSNHCIDIISLPSLEGRCTAARWTIIPTIFDNGKNPNFHGKRNAASQTIPRISWFTTKSAILKKE